MVALAIVAGCTARGGGYLPPAAPAFSEMASFGFSVSCERSSQGVSTNPPAGRLRIELSYTDHGLNPTGGAFTIHGEADSLDPVTESMFCIGQEPPPELGNERTFVGPFRLTSRQPTGFPPECADPDTDGPFCRFEVTVRDNDDDHAPSFADHFTITLLSFPKLSVDPLDPPPTLIYTRTGYLEGGNLEVD